MTDRALYRLNSPNARAMAVQHVRSAPDGYAVEIKAPTHSDEQRRKMHAMAGDLAKQLPWCGRKMSTDDWKRFCTAKLKKDQFVFDCDEFGQPDTSSIVSLGCSTKDKGVKFLSEMIGWFEWMGAQHGVVWGDESKKIAVLEEMRRK